MMLIAEVSFLDQEKGGRFSPPQSGFKPQILVGNVKTSCVITPIDESVFVFDFHKTHLVKIDLQFSDVYKCCLGENDGFSLFEGNKKIGEGRVISLA